MKKTEIKISCVDPDMRAILWAFFLHTNTRYTLMAPNCYVGWSNEMDIVGWRKSGFIDEIEIKLSRSDFLADFNKTSQVKFGMTKNQWGHEYADVRRIPKHEALADGLSIPNYFSFLIPTRLVDKCEIPDHAGLYVFNPDMLGGRIKTIKAAPRLHSRKFKGHTRQKVAEKMAWRYWGMLEHRK